MQRRLDFTDNAIASVYGIVTTGSIWRFLKLEGTTVTIDLNEVYLTPLEVLLGLLAAIVQG